MTKDEAANLLQNARLLAAIFSIAEAQLEVKKPHSNAIGINNERDIKLVIYICKIDLARAKKAVKEILGDE